MTDAVTIHEGDCLDVLPTLASGSVDAVVCDPPYPCIKRSYGYWTEAEWFAMMRRVVPECMRVLKPTGSAVFILQPNSEKVGRMRTWLWEFMVWVGKEWGIVQDAYWWNPAILPNAGACSGGLMRASVKVCVWLGVPGCHRDQSEALWEPNWDRIAAHAVSRAAGRQRLPSGNSVNYQRIAKTVTTRGGTTPFNLLPFTNANSASSAGSHGHGAGTPLQLLRWWVRYICPPGGTVLDPFLGSGTTAVACLREGRKCVGIEKQPEYVGIAHKRVAEELSKTPLFDD